MEYEHAPQDETKSTVRRNMCGCPRLPGQMTVRPIRLPPPTDAEDLDKPFAMLGHESAAMALDTYADLFDDDLDDVAKRLAERAVKADVGEAWAEAFS